MRLKRGIKPIKSSLRKLLRINPVHYYWKDTAKGSTLQTGVIAQELEKNYPELVTTDKEGMLSVNYIGLIPHIIQSVKEQQQEIQALKTEIATLRALVEKLGK